MSIRVRYTYHRYTTTETEEFEDLEEALSRAVSDINYNQAYPVKIEALDGSFCFERGKPLDWGGPLDKLLDEVEQRKFSR